MSKLNRKNGEEKILNYFTSGRTPKKVSWEFEREESARAYYQNVLKKFANRFPNLDKEIRTRGLTRYRQNEITAFLKEATVNQFAVGIFYLNHLSPETPEYRVVQNRIFDDLDDICVNKPDHFNGYSQVLIEALTHNTKARKIFAEAVSSRAWHNAQSDMNKIEKTVKRDLQREARTSVGGFLEGVKNHDDLADELASEMSREKDIREAFNRDIRIADWINIRRIKSRNFTAEQMAEIENFISQPPGQERIVDNGFAVHFRRACFAPVGSDEHKEAMKCVVDVLKKKYDADNAAGLIFAECLVEKIEGIKSSIIKSRQESMVEEIKGWVQEWEIMPTEVELGT